MLVEGREVRGEAAGAVLAPGGEEFEGGVGFSEASGGVDAGRDFEADVGGADVGAEFGGERAGAVVGGGFDAG